jgi:hypothetical protein
MKKIKMRPESYPVRAIRINYKVNYRFRLLSLLIDELLMSVE